MIQHEVGLGEREAGQRHVELEISQRLEFDGEDLGVPAGIEREMLSAIWRTCFFECRRALPE